MEQRDRGHRTGRLAGTKKLCGKLDRAAALLHRNADILLGRRGQRARQGKQEGQAHRPRSRFGGFALPAPVRPPMMHRPNGKPCKDRDNRWIARERHDLHDLHLGHTGDPRDHAARGRARLRRPALRRPHRLATGPRDPQSLQAHRSVRHDPAAGPADLPARTLPVRLRQAGARELPGAEQSQARHGVGRRRRAGHERRDGRGRGPAGAPRRPAAAARGKRGRSSTSRMRS